MSASSVRWRRCWEHFRAGDLTEVELVSSFVDHLNRAAVAADWSSLPPGYQEVVRGYFRANRPADLPYLVFGRVTPEERLAFREKAEAVAALLRVAPGAHAAEPPRPLE